MPDLDYIPIDFDHLERMQRRVMTPESYITERDFYACEATDQIEYYNWLRRQCGDLCDLI